ncbi:MAG: BamA/TamA family outer membrane protein [Gammaproteobacteria bacterium]
MTSLKPKSVAAIHYGLNSFTSQRSLATIILFMLAITNTAYATDWISERRKSQFPDESAYLLVPLPYSMPGIGDGAFLMANFSNLANTTTDAYMIKVVGDAQGYAYQIDELPIIAEHLFLKLYQHDIDRAAVNQYDIRGMDNTHENNYSILDISLAKSSTIDINLSFYDRRLNFYYSHIENKFTLSAIRDFEGNLITQLDKPYSDSDTQKSYRFALDLTDDYLDPRQGFRFSISYLDRPANASKDPDFYALDYKILTYLPMGENNTLVFNYYQSDAHVRTPGDTDPDNIRTEIGLNCDISDSECLRAEQQLVDNLIRERSLGTATNLGGLERLRAYPDDRFKGAHMAFVGAEFRLNFVQEATPFNYLIWKDVRTGYQLAFFAEAGTVSERSSERWDERRYSYGTGFRLLTASGSVYRADIAFGDEDMEISVFFFYPWE